MKTGLGLIAGAVVIMLAALGCGGGEPATTKPAIVIEEPKFGADDSFNVSARLENYEESGEVYPKCLTLFILVRENPAWGKSHPFEPWNMLYDDNWVTTVSPVPGAIAKKPLENDLCHNAEQGTYSAVFPKAFDSVGEWRDGEKPLCPFEAIVLEVRDRRIAEARKEFACEPLLEVVEKPQSENAPKSGSRRESEMVDLGEFSIDKYEVTNAQYRRCVEEGPCYRPENADSETHAAYFDVAAFDAFPVVNVSWYDAHEYCTWVGKRLPSDEEWLIAAKGVDLARTYPWGDSDADCSLANYGDCVGDTVAVGSYPDGATPEGVHDLLGNVWEWVDDWHTEDVAKGLRGSCYDYQPTLNSLKDRKPEAGAAWAGFRCAR